MMNKEYLKSLIDCVSGIEVKSEAEQIAKYELIEYVEDLEQMREKAIDKLYCWGEVLDADFQKIMLDILKEVE